MYKVLWFLRRKHGITHEQFRDHYEASHAKLAERYFGHLMLEYRRNYRAEVAGGGVIDGGDGASFGPRAWDYDCIAEWVMPDAAAFETIMAMFGDAAIGQVFYEDEEHFLDRPSILMVKCEVCSSAPDHLAAAPAGPS